MCAREQCLYMYGDVWGCAGLNGVDWAGQVLGGNIFWNDHINGVVLVGPDGWSV